MSFGAFGVVPVANNSTQLSGFGFGQLVAKPSNSLLGAADDVSKQHVSALPSLRNDTLVKVIVGEEQASFYVHRNLICESSPFFKAALNGAFKEAAEGKVVLPDDDPDVFDQFLQWIYTKSYTLAHLVDASSESLCKQSWQCVRLYVFAEKTQVERLKDHILHRLFLFHQRHRKLQTITYNSVEFAYDHTLPDSRLRKLLVAMAVWTEAKIDSKAITALPQFAGELAVGLQERVHHPNPPDPFAGTPETFLSSESQLSQTANTGSIFGGATPQTAHTRISFGGMGS